MKVVPPRDGVNDGATRTASSPALKVNINHQKDEADVASRQLNHKMMKAKRKLMLNMIVGVQVRSRCSGINPHLA
jgi:hypothetical protein